MNIGVALAVAVLVADVAAQSHPDALTLHTNATKQYLHDSSYRIEVVQERTSSSELQWVAEDSKSTRL